MTQVKEAADGETTMKMAENSFWNDIHAADKISHSISHTNKVKRQIQIEWKRKRFIKHNHYCDKVLISITQ